jgi:hypothetical protein
VTTEEKQAVEATRKLRLPNYVANYVANGRRLGHELVSQGCARFRCVICNQNAYMDEPSNLSYYQCKGETP